MSIGGDDGITLPKVTKCADIKRKKNRHIEYRHRGVFYVVIAERIQDKQFKAVLRIPDFYPGSEFFHPGSRVQKIPDPHQRVVSLTQKIVSKLSEI
jgi:hypothetical protein